MPFPVPAARRILMLAVGVGVLVDIAVVGNASGINVVLVTAALLAAAALVAGPDRVARCDPADAWLPVAALVLAAMPAVRADDWLVTADVLLAAATAAGTIAVLGGARITRGLVPAVLATATALVVACATGAASVLRAALGPRRANGDSETGHARRPAVPAWVVRWAPVLRGLVIALPVVALFALLFASADAVFAELARTALSVQVDVDLSNVMDRTVWVTIVAWVVAGLLALAAGVPPMRHGGDGSTAELTGPSRDPASDAPPPPPWWTNRSLGAASVSELRQPIRLGSIEAATVLALVAILFAGFVLLQLAYLFGGRDTLAVAGLTYADYARRGFFELVAVAVLAGILVVVLDLAVASRGRAQLLASLALLALTGVVLLSAFVRLRLYQDTYGWTELRFVVVVAIGWLAVALAATAWLLHARMTRWTLHVLGILVLVSVAGMNVVGPQAFVTDRNLERALNPAVVPPGGRTGLDGAYLASLGDEAVAGVVAAYEHLPAASRPDVDRFLDGRRRALESASAYQGWPAWNLTRGRALAALEGWTPGGR